MDNSELITELLQALTNDVKDIGRAVKKAPTDPAVDYGPRLEALTKAVEALPDRLKAAPASPDLSVFTDQLNRIEHLSRQHPDRKASQYVQIGAYASGLMVLLLILMTSLALSWRSERNAFEASDWKWRNLRQNDPVYVGRIDSTYSVASQASDEKELAGYHQWIIQQEQADVTREAARQAAEQAAALTKQANQLEGDKSQPKP